MREFSSGIADAKNPEYFGRDHKSRLQERLQAQGLPLPAYRVSGEVGPDHRKLFHVEVFVGNDLIAQGVGRTKKEAEQEAAKLGLAALGVKDV
jgi:ribonuclease-3